MQKKKKVEEKETERREVRDRVAGNFRLGRSYTAMVAGTFWMLGGVNEQGFVGQARDQIL